jgi:anti-sigma B factor antagonist
MATPQFEHIKTSMVGEVAVVEVLPKELRFPPQAHELGAELSLVGQQEWAKQLVVNLKHTKYLSSTGFAVLVNLVKQVKDLGGEVKFSAIDPEVQIGAEIIGLDKLAKIYATEHDAIKAFG